MRKSIDHSLIHGVVAFVCLFRTDLDDSFASAFNRALRLKRGAACTNIWFDLYEIIVLGEICDGVRSF